MRELRTCDFCDGDAAGTFEIVPPELEPTESEQRRVALCPDCRERLEGLLEPLLARARDGGAADGAAPDATGDERSDGGSSAATASTTADAAASGPDTADTDDSAAATGDADDSAAATADADDTDASLEDGITFARDERGSGVDSADETAADTPGDDDSSTADADDGEPDRGDDRDGNATGSSGRPAAYAKVVRLLRNREFPMDRSAVEELAAGAYDLESREVEAIVDRAVAEGEFAEDGSQLRRP